MRQLEFTPEERAKRKLMVMTPMYGGQCFTTFALSFAALCVYMARLGIEVVPHFLTNESLVQRARNYCVDEFMRSDCTHGIFIDADIGFNPNDVAWMLALMSDDSPYDVMVAAYPKKNISWEKIALAVDKGVAEEDPEQLENYVGDYVITPTKAGTYNLEEPFVVAEAGTGFMMIRRKTFEKLREAYPHKDYTPDHIRSKHFDGERKIHAYFDCEIDPQSNRYLSEDYYFCRNVNQQGMQIWLCPWMQLNHTGTYQFGGSLAALASIGADPTAVQYAHKKIAKKQGKKK